MPETLVDVTTAIDILSMEARKPNATPTSLRECARKLFNGSLESHPLLGHSHIGFSMRFEIAPEEYAFVPVPEHWEELER